MTHVYCTVHLSPFRDHNPPPIYWASLMVYFVKFPWRKGDDLRPEFFHKRDGNRPWEVTR